MWEAWNIVISCKIRRKLGTKMQCKKSPGFCRFWEFLFSTMFCWPYFLGVSIHSEWEYVVGLKIECYLKRSWWSKRRRYTRPTLFWKWFYVNVLIFNEKGSRQKFYLLHDCITAFLDLSRIPVYWNLWNPAQSNPITYLEDIMNKYSEN